MPFSTFIQYAILSQLVYLLSLFIDLYAHYLLLRKPFLSLLKDNKVAISRRRTTPKMVPSHLKNPPNIESYMTMTRGMWASSVIAQVYFTGEHVIDTQMSP